MRSFRNLALLALLLQPAVRAFVGPASFAAVQVRAARPNTSSTHRVDQDRPAALQRQRQSVAAIQTRGLFGLGFAEIAIILVGVGFVLGPANIGKLVKSSSQQASVFQEELKKVPAEFEKGMEEGESNARSRKAKVIPVKKERSEDGDE
jgi:Sec-independent protein translocase protein TatA